VQNWGPVRRPERLVLVGPLPELERTPLQRQERMLLQDPVRAQVRGPLMQPDRQPLRCENRVRFRAQVQHQKVTLFRLDERGPMRYQVMGAERPLLLRAGRRPFPALLRMQEWRPFRGRELPQPSAGR